MQQFPSYAPILQAIIHSYDRVLESYRSGTGGIGRTPRPPSPLSLSPPKRLKETRSPSHKRRTPTPNAVPSPGHMPSATHLPSPAHVTSPTSAERELQLKLDALAMENLKLVDALQEMTAVLPPPPPSPTRGSFKRSRCLGVGGEAVV